VPFGDAVWYSELHTLVGGCVCQRVELLPSPMVHDIGG